MPLKSVWKTLVDTGHKSPPSKDAQTVVADSMMLELEQSIKVLEKMKLQKAQEDNAKKTGVDYSWLVTATPKMFEIPQFERLELEQLFYQVKPEECGKILSLFRDALLNDPEPCELPSLFRACTRQILQQRPKEQSLTEWVMQRTMSLTSLKSRHAAKVMPSGDHGDAEEVKMEEQKSRESSTTTIFTTDIDSLPV